MSPSPSCPQSFLPQLNAPPETERAKLCSPPAATWTTGIADKDLTCWGEFTYCSFVPRPSCPLESWPQVYNWPSVRKINIILFYHIKPLNPLNLWKGFVFIQVHKPFLAYYILHATFCQNDCMLAPTSHLRHLFVAQCFWCADRTHARSDQTLLWLQRQVIVNSTGNWRTIP